MPQHRPSKGPLVFAYPEEPFFKVIGDHITEEGQKVGYDTIVLSADEDVAKQSNQVKDFIVKKVSAIVLSPCESKSIVPVIQEANQAGIPVITVDIPCNEPGVEILTQVAPTTLAAVARRPKPDRGLGEAGGKVAVLHYKQAESCRLRVKAWSIIDHTTWPPKAKSILPWNQKVVPPRTFTRQLRTPSRPLRNCAVFCHQRLGGPGRTRRPGESRQGRSNHHRRV